MHRPLQSIKDQMESFSAHLERWAHRIKVSLMSLLVKCVDGWGFGFWVQVLGFGFADVV